MTSRSTPAQRIRSSTTTTPRMLQADDRARPPVAQRLPRAIGTRRPPPHPGVLQRAPQELTGPADGNHKRRGAIVPHRQGRRPTHSVGDRKRPGSRAAAARPLGREAPPPTAESPADLVFPLILGESGQAHAGTCGHDRPTAATRCAEVRSTMRPILPLQSGWSGHCLQGCGAGLHDATRLQNSGQVSKSGGPRSPTLRPGLRPEGVAPSGQHNIAICHRRPPSPDRWASSAGRALWSQLGTRICDGHRPDPLAVFVLPAAPGLGTL